MSSSKNKRVEYVLEFHQPPGSRPMVRDDIRQYRADTPFHAIHVGDHVSPFTLQWSDEGLKQLSEELGPLEVGASTIVVDRIEHHLLDRDDCTLHAVWIFTKRERK